MLLKPCSLLMATWYSIPLGTSSGPKPWVRSSKGDETPNAVVFVRSLPPLPFFSHKKEATPRQEDFVGRCDRFNPRATAPLHHTGCHNPLAFCLSRKDFISFRRLYLAFCFTSYSCLCQCFHFGGLVLGILRTRSVFRGCVIRFLRENFEYSQFGIRSVMILCGFSHREFVGCISIVTIQGSLEFSCFCFVTLRVKCEA